MKQTMIAHAETQDFDARMMKKALGLAIKSEKKGEVPIGAVLVDEKGQILAESTNLRETKCTVLGHAELVVIHQANQKRKSWRLNGCTLYVTLEPCLMCAAALVQSRISRVVYGANDPKGGGLGSLQDLSKDSRLNHQFQVDRGLMSEESSQLLKDFFKMKRRRNKNSLTTRFIDFWLLGGLSILTLVVFILFDRFFFTISSESFYFLSLLLVLKIGFELPHIIASYKLTYTREKQFIYKHWVITLLLPTTLSLIAGVILFGGQKFEVISTHLLELSASAIFFLFGWHRSMQVYGCMTMYSKFDDYKLSLAQRQILKCFVLVMWIFGYTNLIQNLPHVNFYGLNILFFNVNEQILFVADLAMIFAWLGFTYFIVYKNLKSQKKLPSMNFMIAPVALFLWWSAFLWSQNFYLFLLPTFHSIQQLAFVFGAHPTQDKYFNFSKTKFFYNFKLVFALVATSAVFYWGGQWLFNQFHLSRAPEVIIGVLILFSSLHHYFLDGIIWRRNNIELND